MKLEWYSRATIPFHPYSPLHLFFIFLFFCGCLVQDKTSLAIPPFVPFPHIISTIVIAATYPPILQQEKTKQNKTKRNNRKMSSSSSAPPPRSNSSSRSSYNGKHGLQGQGHNRHGSNSTLSVHSVSIRDSCYRDLQTLQADHAALYTQLKMTQQTLQHSYQDQVMAQERSKRAETDSGRLRTQMDDIL